MNKELPHNSILQCQTISEFESTASQTTEVDDLHRCTLAKTIRPQVHYKLTTM